METNTEHDLIIRCRKGDEQAWRLLLTRYEAYVYRLCFRISGSRDDALDLTRLRLLWLELGQDEKIEVPEILPFIRQQAVTRARAAGQEVEGTSGVSLWEAQKLAWQPFLAGIVQIPGSRQIGRLAMLTGRGLPTVIRGLSSLAGMITGRKRGRR